MPIVEQQRPTVIPDLLGIPQDSFPEELSKWIVTSITTPGVSFKHFADRKKALQATHKMWRQLAVIQLDSKVPVEKIVSLFESKLHPPQM